MADQNTKLEESDSAEQQRERLRSLCRWWRYEQAADLAATLSDDILLFAPCETIADHISKKRPQEAARLYGIAADMWRFEGTQATGSGEGLVARDNLNRVSAKLAQLSDSQEDIR